MRSWLWWLAVILLVGLVGWAGWLGLSGTYTPFRVWSTMPSEYDLGGVGAVLLLWLSIAFAQRAPTKRRGTTALVFGLLALVVGCGGGVATSAQANALFSQQPLMPVQKPQLSTTIIGYHWEAPTHGGMVAMADGSVRWLSSEEFATTSKATPPDTPVSWVSPTKTPETKQPPDDPNIDPATREAMQRVRAAQDRTRIGNDLKQVVTAWFYYPNEHEGQPPRAPQDLIATGRLSPAQQTSLQDGTLVWYYGWRRTIPTDETRAAIQWYARASWFGLHLTGFGLGLVLFGVVTRRRAKRANLANLG